MSGHDVRATADAPESQQYPTGHTGTVFGADLADAVSVLAVLREPLQEGLYAWYVRAGGRTAGRGDGWPAAIDPPAALYAAHAGARRFVGGWTAVAELEAGAVLARQGDDLRAVGRAQYVVPSRPGLTARTNDPLLVSDAWVWTDEDTGFWHTRRGPWPPPGARELVRTYLHVAPERSVEVVRCLTVLLEQHRAVSYQLKCVCRDGTPDRADSMVLYLSRVDARALETELCARVGASGDLLPEVPRFTRVLGPGLAQSEATTEGESYGQTVCALLADAWRSGGRFPAAGAPERFRRNLEAAGRDPDAPWRLSARYLAGHA